MCESRTKPMPSLDGPEWDWNEEHCKSGREPIIHCVLGLKAYILALEKWVKELEEKHG